MTAEAMSHSTAEWARLLVGIARPRVMALVVFTGLPALWMGQTKPLDPMLAASVLLGTALAGASSSAFNAFIERDADARMARTRQRPLPAAMVLPSAVVAYGIAAAVGSAVILAVAGGWQAAAIAWATIAFYVLGYTIYLKPRTPQNIVIGGAAGATAPLIASAAAHGVVTPAAWWMFLVIFLWTPPHFWGVAIFRKAEYEAAGFPMMPSVVGDQGTRWRSLGYVVLLWPLTLAPVAMGWTSWVYGVAALGLGAWFVALVVRALRAREPSVDYAVFKGSVAYLAALFSVLLLDLALR